MDGEGREPDCVGKLSYPAKLTTVGEMAERLGRTRLRWWRSWKLAWRMHPEGQGSSIPVPMAMAGERKARRPAGSAARAGQGLSRDSCGYCVLGKGPGLGVATISLDIYWTPKGRQK